MDSNNASVYSRQNTEVRVMQRVEKLLEDDSREEEQGRTHGIRMITQPFSWMTTLDSFNTMM